VSEVVEAYGSECGVLEFVGESVSEYSVVFAVISCVSCE